MLVLPPNVSRTFVLVIVDYRFSKAGIVELPGKSEFVFYVIVMILVIFQEVRQKFIIFCEAK